MCTSIPLLSCSIRKALKAGTTLDFRSSPMYRLLLKLPTILSCCDWEWYLIAPSLAFVQYHVGWNTPEGIVHNGSASQRGCGHPIYSKSKRIHLKRLVVDNRHVPNPIVATGTDGFALGESYTKELQCKRRWRIVGADRHAYTSVKTFCQLSTSSGTVRHSKCGCGVYHPALT